MTAKYYRILTPRIRVVVHEREVWAESEDEALQADASHPWPETYDERPFPDPASGRVDGESVVIEVTCPLSLAFADRKRRGEAGEDVEEWDAFWANLPAAEERSPELEAALTRAIQAALAEPRLRVAHGELAAWVASVPSPEEDE